MLYIHGVGHFHPENEITNQLLEELDIGTSDEWIVERTGIRSRRTVLDLDYIRETKNQDLRAADDAAVYSNVELGRRAAEKAIVRAGIDRSEIGMILAGGTASLKGLAAMVQQELGLTTRVADPISGLDVAPSVAVSALKRNTPNLMVAMGLALRGFD